MTQEWVMEDNRILTSSEFEDIFVKLNFLRNPDTAKCYTFALRNFDPAYRYLRNNIPILLGRFAGTGCALLFIHSTKIAPKLNFDNNQIDIRMVHRFANKNKILAWLTQIIKDNLSVYKIRKNRWESFANCITLVSPQNVRETIIVDNDDYNIIWQYLTARNDRIGSDMELAFRKSIDLLLDLVTIQDQVDEAVSASERENDSESQPESLPTD